MDSLTRLAPPKRKSCDRPWMHRRSVGTPKPAQTAVCISGSGSVRFGSSCYLYQDVYLTQPDAEQLCSSRGYRLVSIQSEDENDFIQSKH